jgi:hypothetical protein
MNTIKDKTQMNNGLGIISAVQSISPLKLGAPCMSTFEEQKHKRINNLRSTHEVHEKINTTE